MDHRSTEGSSPRQTAEQRSYLGGQERILAGSLPLVSCGSIILPMEVASARIPRRWMSNMPDMVFPMPKREQSPGNVRGVR